VTSWTIAVAYSRPGCALSEGCETASFAAPASSLTLAPHAQPVHQHQHRPVPWAFLPFAQLMEKQLAQRPSESFERHREVVRCKPQVEYCSDHSRALGIARVELRTPLWLWSAAA
jgi:hypothetical protein